MKVIIAAEAGFCFGVKRALNVIYRLNEQEQELQVYGRLIHNTTVLQKLKSQNIDTIERLEEIDLRKKLVIRTHGIPKQEEEKLKKDGISYVDATCPLVKKLHHIIQNTDETHTQLIIVGDKKHPEIIAAKSYAQNAAVVNSEEEAAALEKRKSIRVIAQTTLDTDLFERIVALLKTKAETIEIHDTICEATKVRQQAVKELAPNVDFMVVVGGKDSSNTRKLFNIAAQRNKNTFFVENSSQVSDPDFIKKIRGFRTAGIAAGASTPPEEIAKTKEILKNITIEKEINNGKRKRYH